MFRSQHYSRDADGLCCRLAKALSNRHDTVDAIRTGETNRQTSPLPSQSMLIPSHVSSRIDFQELQIGKVVGTGEFAEVYEGTYRNGRVAIKLLKEPNSFQLLLHEADIMR